MWTPRERNFNPRTSYEVRHRHRRGRRPDGEDFNPRTSYEVRRYHYVIRKDGIVISIHAPLTRCDDDRIAVLLSVLAFQSTHLLRGATRRIINGIITGSDFNPRTSYEVRR